MARSPKPPPGLDREIEEMRLKAARMMPHALECALDSYYRFALDQGIAEDPGAPKIFREHHTACKSAIGHLDALIRLLHWTNAETKDAAQLGAEELAGLLADARAAIERQPIDGDPDEGLR